MFEPDIPVLTMSLQLGMRRYGRLIGECSCTPRVVVHLYLWALNFYPGLVLIDIQYQMRET
jgi:hypothetical protein